MWPFIKYKIRYPQQPPKSAAFIRIPTFMVRRLPDFILIGAPKCGTTSMYSYIETHPDFVPPLRKEIHYYSIHYRLTKVFYRAHFPLVFEEGSITGEASPSYYWHPHAPGRVKKDLPDVRLVMCLRNPVDRAYSDYWMQVRQGWEVLSFEDAIQQESGRVDSHYERVNREPLYWADNLSRHAYVLRGRYQLHLRRWLDTFPRDRILFITIDQMKADPQGTFDRVCEHIGLDLGHEPVFKVHGRHGHTHPKMAPETRKMLDKTFEEDNQVLCRMLQDDFPWA